MLQLSKTEKVEQYCIHITNFNILDNNSDNYSFTKQVLYNLNLKQLPKFLNVFSVPVCD